jgi:hypothetical protein
MGPRAEVTVDDLVKKKKKKLDLAENRAPSSSVIHPYSNHYASYATWRRSDSRGHNLPQFDLNSDASSKCDGGSFPVKC